MRGKIDIPYVESLKSYKSYLIADKSFPLPTDTPFGNLILKWADITLRIESVNRLIEKVFTGFYNPPKIIGIPGALDPIESYQQLFNTEQIFYWLRKTADELIGVIYLLHYQSIQKKYPEMIKIDSIGKFLGTANPFEGILEDERSFLRQLNDISNCYKHSFINSELLAYKGSECPVVFALHLPNNDFVKHPQPKFHRLELRKVIKEYEAFLINLKASIKSTYLDK